MSLLILTVGATPAKADPVIIQPIDKPANFGKLIQFVSGTSENPAFVARYARISTAGIRGAAVIENLAAIGADPAVAVTPGIGTLLPAIGIAAVGVTAAVLIDHYTGGHVYHMLRDVTVGSLGGPTYDPLDYDWVLNPHLQPCAPGQHPTFCFYYSNLAQHYWPYEPKIYDPVLTFGENPVCTDKFTGPLADAFSWSFAGCTAELDSWASLTQAWAIKTLLDENLDQVASLSPSPGYQCTFRGFVPEGGCGVAQWSYGKVKEHVNIGVPVEWPGSDYDIRVPFNQNQDPDPIRTRYLVHQDPDTEATVNHALEPKNPNFPDPFASIYPAAGMPGCHGLSVADCEELVHEIDPEATFEEIEAPEHDAGIIIGTIVSTDPGEGDPFPGPGVAIRLYINPEEGVHANPAEGQLTWYYDGVVPTSTVPGRIRVRIADPDPDREYLLECAGQGPFTDTQYANSSFTGQNWLYASTYSMSSGTGILWRGEDFKMPLPGRVGTYTPVANDAFGCAVLELFNDPFTGWQQRLFAKPKLFAWGQPTPEGEPDPIFDDPPGPPADGSTADPTGYDPNQGAVFVAPGGDCICPTGTIDFSPITDINVGNNIPFGIFTYAHDIIAPLAATPVRPSLSLDVNFDVTSGGVSSDVGTHEFAIDIPETWFTDVDDWFEQMRHWESLLLWVGAWWALLKYFLKLRDVSYGLDTGGEGGDIFGAYGRGELSAKEAADRLL